MNIKIKQKISINKINKIFTKDDILKINKKILTYRLIDNYKVIYIYILKNNIYFGHV